MFIGALKINLSINVKIESLKDKRRVVKSIRDKLRNSFNISVAEVDFLDQYYRTGLGISFVSNDKDFVNITMNKIIDRIENFHSVTVEKIKTEIL